MLFLFVQSYQRVPAARHAANQAFPRLPPPKAVNEDARRTIARDKVNFFVLYDGEEENGSVPHVLESVEYRTTDDADYDSWLLLDAMEEIGEPAAMEE